MVWISSWGLGGARSCTGGLPKVWRFGDRAAGEVLERWRVKEPPISGDVRRGVKGEPEREPERVRVPWGVLGNRENAGLFVG